MSRRAVVALGIGQCINWGVLYYAFAVLLVPLERELAVPTWVVAGAFSLALLISAMLAPAVGRWSDGGHGPLVMQAGAALAATLLVAWTFIPGVVGLYFVWAGLGVCMAATLYEPAFVIVGRAHDEPLSRLRALAILTLLGGLASTVFLPATALMVSVAGWRPAVVAIAALLVVSAGLARLLAFQTLERRTATDTVAATPASTPSPGASVGHVMSHSDTPSGFALISGVLALASFAGVAFTANIVPALGERGISAEMAAMLGGLMGVMQLPGRALMLNGAFAGPPSRLLAWSIALQALGFGAIALGPSAPWMVGGAVLFALGAGLTTLARPHLVQMMFDRSRSGYFNGRIARHQQLARAAGPLAVAWLAGLFGYSTVLSAIAIAFAAVTLLASGALKAGAATAMQQEAA